MEMARIGLNLLCAGHSVLLPAIRTGESKRLMSDPSTENITLYVSNWCAHSRSVERFFERNNVLVKKIRIDGDDEARAELIALNNGYASVPTLVLADGTVLTEPSINQLRQKLGLETAPGLMGRIRGVLRDKDSD
jgi:mycoredoxin